jgi:uncharacterized protein YcbX
MPAVSALYVYPIKSTHRVAVTEAVVTRRGLEHDRCWMLVGASGRFLSQREVPHLATVQATLHPDGRMRVDAPGMSALEVPGPSEAMCTVQVWGSVVQARRAAATVSEWFGAYLGREAHLVYLPEETLRRVDPAYAVQPDDHVSFADGYPLLLTTEASLQALNARLSVPLPMTRFRPNIVLLGTAPFEEDTWRRIRVGTTVFEVVKPCGRCVITTFDQETGQGMGEEPLATLATFRKQGSKVLFGENLIPSAPGMVRVGEEIEVLAWR